MRLRNNSAVIGKLGSRVFTRGKRVSKDKAKKKRAFRRVWREHLRAGKDPDELRFRRSDFYTSWDAF